jgi:Transposase DDE domain
MMEVTTLSSEGQSTMISIDLVSLMTLIYVLVDDWYQSTGCVLLKGKPGMKPEFSDSQMLTLMVMQDFIPYPGETQYIAYIRANHIHEFPKVVDQSQYNRRARRLGWLLETLRQDWLKQLGASAECQLLLDTKPVPVVGCTRSKRHSFFLGRAAYGYCAARRMHCFGYKLVSLTTLDGLPVVYDLVPANLDEREAAEAVIYRVHDCDIFADKGFLGDDWQADVRWLSNNRIWTSKRANQARQNPPLFDSLLKQLHERIEATFHQLQNTGRHLEHLLAKTLPGLCTRLIAKVSSLVLRRLLQRDFGIDIQSFACQPL